LDLMGYRQQLMETDRTGNITDHQQIRGIFSPVVERRQSLIRSVLGYLEHIQKVAARKQEELGKPAGVDVLNAVKFRPTGFSDCIFIEKALRGDDAGGIFSLSNLIVVSGLLYLTSLANRSPIRGGIDIGYGVSVDNVLYSSATVKAYELEQCAKYPRILLGERYLSSIDALGHFAPALAERMKPIVFKDPVDGRIGLDVLGAAYKKAYINDLPPPQIKQIWIFANEEYARFKDNAKLRGYYERLIGYVEERLPVWGLDKSTSL